MISTRAYNLRGQVSALEVTSPLGDVLDQSFTYGYVGGAPGPVDGGANLDQVIDSRDSSQSRFYFYDDLDRLWKSTNLSGTPLFTYLYDGNGNRTQQVAPGGTTNYSYQSSTDRIAQATGVGAKHFAHDAFGSRIWAGPVTYAGQPSHLYNQGNRLIEVRDPVTQAVLGQYTYDAAGRRVRKIAGGVTTLYFYDSAGHLVESHNLSTSPATRRSYVFVEDEPMGIVDQPPSGSPVFSWIHADRLGTPLAVTSTPGSGSAKATWRATYEPFGLATPDEDPDGDSQSFALDLRFPGQVFDAESGGHDNFFRTYDAATGTYLSTDPLGQADHRNLYQCALLNPMANTDPLGLFVGPPPPVAPPPIPVLPVVAAGAIGFAIGSAIEPFVSPYIQTALDYYFGGQSSSGGSSEGPTNEDPCDDSPDCEASFASDNSVCRAIGQRSKARATLCYESALRRNAACKAGDPPSSWPPLITWNN